MTTKILIYEDNEALRTGIQDFLDLAEDMQVVAAYENCLQVEEQVKEFKPDVILMDIEMPEITGIEAVKKIRGFDRNCAIIMLTVFDDNQHILDAISAGASGYLLKKNISDKLLSSIKEVLEGGAPMSPAVARLVIKSFQKSKASDYDFTKREVEILDLLCKGNSYKMIALETGLTFETIRSYIKNIYSKLEVHSATEAVSKAINEKLI